MPKLPALGVAALLAAAFVAAACSDGTSEQAHHDDAAAFAEELVTVMERIDRAHGALSDPEVASLSPSEQERRYSALEEDMREARKRLDALQIPAELNASKGLFISLLVSERDIWVHMVLFTRTGQELHRVLANELLVDGEEKGLVAVRQLQRDLDGLGVASTGFGLEAYARASAVLPLGVGPSPTASAIPAGGFTRSPVSMPTTTSVPAPTATPDATATPVRPTLDVQSPAQVATAAPQSSPTPASRSTHTPTPEPSATPTRARLVSPTQMASPAPTLSPVPSPTALPSPDQTSSPTQVPTTASVAPTEIPAPSPTSVAAPEPVLPEPVVKEGDLVVIRFPDLRGKPSIIAHWTIDVDPDTLAAVEYPFVRGDSLEISMFLGIDKLGSTLSRTYLEAPDGERLVEIIDFSKAWNGRAVTTLDGTYRVYFDNIGSEVHKDMHVLITYH